jgi:hypothetical protein
MSSLHQNRPINPKKSEKKSKGHGIVSLSRFHLCKEPKDGYIVNIAWFSHKLIDQVHNIGNLKFFRHGLLPKRVGIDLRRSKAHEELQEQKT